MPAALLEAEIERLFWSHVIDHPDPAITCWLWNGPMREDDYGRFFIDGLEIRAHRFAYESLVGKIPPGMVPDHLCSRRRCVRHLEVVTPEENTRRGRLRTLYASRGRALPPGFRTIIPDDAGLPEGGAWI